MEEKKTVFDYIGYIFTGFGFTIFFIMIFCFLFGNEEKEYSTMFALGDKGLTLSIMFQFFIVSVLIVGTRVVFCTDLIIKKMSVLVRSILLFLSVVVIVSVFIICFGWFPINEWHPWILFLLCLSLSFGTGIWVMMVKQKLENKKMEEGLQKLKNQWKEDGDGK